MRGRMTTVLLGLAIALSSAQDDTEEADPAEPYFLAGLQHYEVQDYDKAHDAFAKCLEITATRTDCMTNLASVLDDLGNQQAAEELYRAVIAVEPTQMDAVYNLALLLQGQPTSFTGDYSGARETIQLYRAVVESDPSRWDAWANMAAALEELNDRPLATVKAYQRGIFELEKQHEEKDEEPDEEDNGYLAKLYYGLGMQLSALSPEDCTAFAADEDALLVGADAGDDGTGSLCLENAQNFLRASTDLDPSNVQAEHMLASLLASTGGSAHEAGVSKASPAFVKALFDDFSDSFEQKLAALEYKVPELVGRQAATIMEVRGNVPFASALDAGCGTGLAGPFLRPVVSGTLSGVDISQKMLDRAAGLTTDRGGAVYDVLLAKDLEQLVRADVLPTAREQSAGVELITAADVLVYFGALTKLLEAFGELAARDAFLVFSCERVSDAEAPSGWQLRASGRFAHTKAYVMLAAAQAGFSLLSYEEIVPRMEHGEPVQGHLFVFGRGAHAASFKQEL